MCYDMKKGNDIEKKQVDNIDHVTQVINSYDINELITFKEFSDTEDEFKIYLSKCPSDCMMIQFLECSTHLDIIQWCESVPILRKMT